MSIALVLGAADTLHPDLEAARALVDPADCTIVAVNDAVSDWPGEVHHFASHHPEEMASRFREREKRGYPPVGETWTRPYPYGMKHREKLCDHVLGGWMGSSGLLGVGVAHAIGSTHVLLCGIPMTKTPHFNAGVWNAAETYRERWEELADDLRKTTRSFSGWTRELLGAPTSQWLASASEVAA